MRPRSAPGRERPRRAVGLALLALRSRGSPRAAVVLVPALIAVSLLSYAFFVVSWPSPDGDVLKATYVLTSVPAWAIAAAWALDRLRPVPRGVLVCLLLLSVLAELPFVVF